MHENVKPTHAKVLAELERRSGKSLPCVDEIEYYTIGVQVEGDRIIGLGLAFCMLAESFANLD